MVLMQLIYCALIIKVKEIYRRVFSMVGISNVQIY